MKVIENDCHIDGRFVVNDKEARAQLYIRDKMVQYIEILRKEIESLDPSSDEEKFNFLCLELDLLCEKMEILSQLWSEIWAFDFEADADEIEA